MKKINVGDIVTPNKRVNRTAIGKSYKVHRVGNGVFYIYDDYGIERQCYPEDFDVEHDYSWIVWTFLILTALVLIATMLGGCNANYHFTKFIQKGGKIDTTERVVEVEKLVKIQGKDSIIKLKIPVACPEIKLPETRYETRWKYRLKRDSIQTVRYVTKWKIKEVKSKEKTKRKEFKNNFWNGVLYGIIGTLIGYFLLGFLIGLITKIK